MNKKIIFGGVIFAILLFSVFASIFLINQIRLIKCNAIKEIDNRDLCYSNIAGDSGNVSICKKINTVAYKDVCFSNVGVKNQDAALCEQSGSQRDFCLDKVAIARGDLTLCDILSDKEYDKPTCYLRIAENKKDPSICQMIESDSIKENCFNLVNKIK